MPLTRRRRRSRFGRPRSRPGSLAVTAVVLLVAGCGILSTTPPAPTPADFGGIAVDLAKRGIAVEQVVSGDAGCDDQRLARTAISFRASGLDQPGGAPVHLFIFANRETFERLLPAVDACAASFVADPAAFESIEASPFVVAGEGPWGARFRAAFREALTEAAGSGD